MTLTFPSFGFANLLALFGLLDRPQVLHRPATLSEDDDAREARAFLHEMMMCHPGAIQSDLGVMTMMALYPKHF